MSWLVSSAVAQGTSHKSTNLPCQDSASYQILSTLGASIAVISDGAGSVARSQIGSKTLTEMICSNLRTYLETEKNITKDSLTSFVKVGIKQVRNKLAEIGNLNEFHATALILIQLPKKLFTFHIGDGSLNIGSYDKKNNIVITRSEPENGEFSNETFFFTEDAWEQHMRVCEIENPCFYIACSDGIDPFIWNGSSGTRLDFIIPLLTKLVNIKNEVNGNEFLKEVITDSRTDAVTSDDKSLIIGIDQNIGIEKLDLNKVYDLNPPKVVKTKDINQSIQDSLQQIVIDKKKESQKNNVTQSTVVKKENDSKFSLSILILMTSSFILLLAIFVILFISNPTLDTFKTKLGLGVQEKTNELVAPIKEEDRVHKEEPESLKNDAVPTTIKDNQEQRPATKKVDGKKEKNKDRQPLDSKKGELPITSNSTDQINSTSKEKLEDNN